jgi:hypothetical protein
MRPEIKYGSACNRKNADNQQTKQNNTYKKPIKNVNNQQTKGTRTITKQNELFQSSYNGQQDH